MSLLSYIGIIVADNPNCACGDLGDLTHILFDCPERFVANFVFYNEISEANKSIGPLNVTCILRNLIKHKIKFQLKEDHTRHDVGDCPICSLIKHYRLR